MDLLLALLPLAVATLNLATALVVNRRDGRRRVILRGEGVRRCRPCGGQPHADRS
jgi:hypothetical protein